MALEIRVPGAAIKRFAIDKPMNALILSASNGTVLMYNLPAAIQNAQALAKSQLQMGVERDLVYTHLEKVEAPLEQTRANVSQANASLQLEGVAAVAPVGSSLLSGPDASQF